MVSVLFRFKYKICKKYNKQLYFVYLKNKEELIIKRNKTINVSCD